MPRKSKGPWWWERRKQWVVDIGRKKHYLGHDENEAWRKWHELMARREGPTPAPVKVDSLAAVLDTFLGWTKQYREPATFDWYLQRIGEFDWLHPDMTVQQLRPFHVQRWIDAKKSSTHKRGCAIALSRALNWAVKQGYIEKNPIQGLEKPAAAKREVVLSDEQYRQILANSSDDEFRDLVTFCWETGCRPQEAFRMESRHLDPAHNRVIFPKEEAKGRKRIWVIYLAPPAASIIAPPREISGRPASAEWRRQPLASEQRRLPVRPDEEETGLPG